MKHAVHNILQHAYILQDTHFPPYIKYAHNVYNVYLHYIQFIIHPIYIYISKRFKQKRKNDQYTINEDFFGIAKPSTIAINSNSIHIHLK